MADEPEVARTVLPELAERLTVGDAASWQLSSIHAGVPQISKATQEQFVPQMINFELLGGVNFKKGCYPGQEIVARSQYLGKLKRRTTLVTIPIRLPWPAQKCLPPPIPNSLAA
jgi:folate-binding protein YgfZ